MLKLHLLALMVLSVPAMMDAQTPLRDGALGRGTLSFNAKATMGDFIGTTTTMTGQMTGGPDLASVRGWVEAPVNTLKTGNGRRDRDLNKSMESDKFPTIRFDLTGVTPGLVRGDTATATLHGTFQIHGVIKTVSLPATVVLHPGAVQVRADTPMNLEDYQISGLSKMLGVLKMQPDIIVHVDLTFAQ